MTTRADILLHPIRLRIVLAMGDEQLTTRGISRRLPDVPPATLYRHIRRLAAAGVLDVVEERRIRGSVERTYALVADAAQIKPEQVAGMTSEDHLRGMTTFTASLIEAFGRYLAHPDAEPTQDAVSYRQVALWLDDAEGEQLVSELVEVLDRYRSKPPSDDRRRLLLSTILIPDLGAQPGEENDGDATSRRRRSPVSS